MELLSRKNTFTVLLSTRERCIKRTELLSRQERYVYGTVEQTKHIYGIIEHT
jgi:hypothetical protein